MEPTGKFVRVDPSSPQGQAICDLCGLRFNHEDLGWNFEWGGQRLFNTRSLRCWRCRDVPQEQLRTIVLPPDPPPILNARTENFAYEEQTPIIFQHATPGQVPPWGAGPATIMCDQSGEVPLVLQYLTDVGE